MCVVLIGRHWESIALPDGRRRLDDPTDFVRLEVAAAIREGVTVIPVLVEGAPMPSPASLPEELRALSRRQAIDLSNERWNYDVGRLVLALDEILGQPIDGLSKETPRSVESEGETPRKREPRKRIATMPFLIAAAAVVLSRDGRRRLARDARAGSDRCDRADGRPELDPFVGLGKPDRREVHLGASLIAAFFRRSPVRVV